VIRYSAKFKSYLNRFRVRKNRAVKEAIYSVAAMHRRKLISLFRLRPGPSREGAAPHAHTRGGLRIVRFAVDRNVAVVGSIKFPNTGASKAIPGVHEFGKTVLIFRPFPHIVSYKPRPAASKAVEALRDRTPKHFAVTLGNTL